MQKEDFWLIEMELKNTKHIGDEDDAKFVDLGDSDDKDFGWEFGNANFSCFAHELDMNLLI